MSASTPENKVKKKIKAVLDNYRNRHHLYYYMSVPNGFGKSTLDYLGFVLGRGFAVEAKKPDGVPTSRQERFITDIQASSTPVFVINDDASLLVFEEWLKCQVEMHG